MTTGKRTVSRHRSEAEWRVLVEAFGRSGKTAVAFADEAGVHVETLRHWRRKLRASSRTALPGGFIELRPSPSRSLQVGAAPLPRWMLEVTFPDGTTARLGG